MLMTGMAFLLKRQKQVSPEGFSLVLIVTLLISYHSYLHDDSLLLLPCLILGREMLRSHKPGFQMLASSTIAVIFVVPLAPTSLTMTASQMFVAILAFSTPMSVRVFTKDKTEPA